MHISAQRSPRSISAAFLKAVAELGYDIETPNQPEPKGFCETVVNQRRGARWSSADGYLKPALRRKNLTLLTEATATRVLIDRGHAVGVEFSQGGKRRVVRAHREIALCAGAVNTPQLLMLSGVGDRDHLAKHGIDVEHHAPEVGQNMLDHLATPLGFEVREDSLFAAERPRELANYLLRRRGMLTFNIAEAYGFIRSQPALVLPNLELLFAPAPFVDEGLGTPSGHAVVIGAILLKPESRGYVALRSADPFAKPIIDPRYLSDPDGRDRAAMFGRICAPASTSPRRRLSSTCSDGSQDLSMRNRWVRKRSNAPLRRARRLSITRQEPAEWASTNPAWSTRNCGSVASVDCGLPTRPSCPASFAATPTHRAC